MTAPFRASLFDLSHPLGSHTPTFPGDPGVRVELTASLEGGAAYTARQLHLSSHAGTHVDAPAHVLAGGSTVDRLPLDLWIGPGILLPVSEALAAPGLWQQAERLLLSGCGDGLPPALVDLLVGSRVRLLGVDAASVDPLDSSALAHHKMLLGNDIVVIENLRPGAAPAGRGMLYCLPLALEAGDGAPARVLWRPTSAGGDEDHEAQRRC